VRQCHKLAAAWYAACGRSRPMLMLFAALKRWRVRKTGSVKAALTSA
jgi:hypothetical protein